MNDNDDELGFDGGGYDAEDWSRLKPFTGAVATLEDVQNRVAIFALGDTSGGRPIDMELPQPVIWWEDDGGGAVALLEDVDLVDDSDPVWRRLVTEAIGDETGEDDKD